MRAMGLGLGLAILLTGSAAESATITASEAYYTFRGTVSAGSATRLLADKATAIGFPGQDAISFVGFERADLPAALRPGQKALLRLQHDPSLARFLFPAEAGRPTTIGAYAVNDIFDPPGAGNFDVIYGPGGRAAIASAAIGAAGVYTWDVTGLVRAWLADPALDTLLALSGIYGNDGPDARNGYAIFHTLGSSTGQAPAIAITPLPAALPLLAVALGGLAILRRRKA
jgi:hypothetical protein